MNGDGPFGVPRPDVEYDQEITAQMIDDNTIAGIEKALSQMAFEQIKNLLAVYNCSIEDLSRKIAKAKGLKNVDATGNKKQDRDAIKDTDRLSG